MTKTKSFASARSLHLCLGLLLLGCLTASAARQDRSWWQKNLSGDSTNLVMVSRDSEVVAVGTTVHLLWRDAGSSDSSLRRLIYLRSTDGGETFGSPTVLEESAGLDTTEGRGHRMAVDGGSVHIVSTRQPVTGAGWYYALEYYRSTNNGATFEPRRALDTSEVAWIFQTPHITAGDGKVTIGYVRSPNWYTDSSLLVLNSLDGGQNFTSRTASRTDKASYNLHDLRRSGAKLAALVHTSAGIGGTYSYTYNLLVAVSSDDGDTWTSNYVCGTNSAGWPKADSPCDYHEKPDLAWVGERLFVTWTGLETNDTRSVFVARSLDNGLSFEEQVNLSLGQSGIPQVSQSTVAAGGSNVYVVWSVPNSGVWVRRSKDGGDSWAPAQFLMGGWWPLVEIDPGVSDGTRAHFLASGIYRQTENAGLTFSVPVMVRTEWGWWGSGTKPFQWSIQPGGAIHFAFTGAETPEPSSDLDFYYRRLDRYAGALSATNQCLVLNGNREELHFENMQFRGGDALQFSNTITVEMWVRPDEGCPRNSSLLYQSHPDNSKGVFKLQTHDSASFRRPSGKILTTNGVVEIWGGEPLLDGEWRHLAMTYDALAGKENLRLYVDGKLSATATGIGPLRPQNQPIFVGGGAASIYETFKGAVDEVRMWNRTLTAAELRTLTMARGLTNAEGLVASYPLDGSTKEISGRSGDGVLMYKEEFAPVVIERVPAITSPALFVAGHNRFFHAEVVAEWATGFATLSGTPPPGLVFDEKLGIISGVPLSTGSFPLIVAATNASGAATQTVSVVVQDGTGVVFRDDFNDRTNAGWSVVRDLYADGYYSFYPGGVKLRAHYGDLWGGNNSAANIFRVPAPTSDCTVTLGVSRFVPGPDLHVQVSVGAYNDDNNYLRLGYGWTGLKSLSFVQEVNGQPKSQEIAHEIGAGPVLLRLSKQGNLCQGFWSTNGVDFHPAMDPVTVTKTLTNVAFWFGIDPRQTNIALVDFFEVKDAAYPFFTAPAATAGQQGAVFSWSAQGPASGAHYTAIGLPAGLGINPASGMITGVPAQSGVFDVTITASNLCGVVQQPLRITLDEAIRGYFRDDFNGQPVAGWNPWAEDTNYYAFTNQSQLVLRANNGDTWGASNRKLNLFAIDAPPAAYWVATLAVSRYEPSARDYNSLHLVAWNDTDNNVRLSYSYGGGTRNVGIASENQRIMDSHSVAQDFGPGPFKMRLVRAGNLYTSYISTNGVDFIPLITNSVSLASAPAKIGFWMGIDPGESNIALLDAFEVRTWGPLLSIERNFEQPQLTWQAHHTVTYQVESSTDLDGWSEFGGPISGQGGVTNIPIQGSGLPMFYRLNAW